jgi:protein arginine N-methyltransferase 1
MHFRSSRRRVSRNLHMIDEHRGYLRDRHRVAAYERALHSLVSPGTVVVDLAAGTGILGLLAVRAGAARVYAIEKEAIAGLAREIARVNGAADVIRGLRGPAASITLPERAGVVVCDQMGPFGIDAGVIELAALARSRFLAPGGTFAPQRLELSLAAVEHGSMQQRLAFWQTRPARFDFSPVAELAVNSPVHLDLEPDNLLSAPAAAATIDLTADVTLPIAMTTTLRASRPGTLHGIGGWFTAWLANDVSMTNSPVAVDRIQRRQLFLPTGAPMVIQAGAAIDVRLQVRPAEGIYAWEIAVGGGVTVSRTSLKAVMLDRDDLLKTHPAHRPVLGREGEATLTVLRLCDGQRTVAEIERAAFAAHHDLFPTEQSAAAFVADVLARA